MQVLADEKVFTCRELLKAKAMENSKLLAGKKKIDTRIKRVNIVEVPDIINWTHEGEFLITTGYPFRDDEEILLKTMTQLKEKGISAFGLKPKRFIETISPAVIERARQLELPLIELPIQANFSDIIHEVTREIVACETYTYSVLQQRMDSLLRKTREKYKNRFLQEWLSGHFNNEMDLCIMANDFGCEIKVDGNYNVVVLGHKNKKNQGDILTEEKWHELRNVTQHETASIFPVVYEGDIVLIISAADQLDLYSKLEEFSKKFDMYLEDFNSYFCISKGHSANLLHNAYQESKRVAEICKLCDLDRKFITSKDLGIYQILSMLPYNEEVGVFVNRFVAPIKEYDKTHNGMLYETLKAYLGTNCNAKKTATQLFTHYNTILYRIEKVRVILGIDLEDAESRLQLSVAVKIDCMKNERK